MAKKNEVMTTEKPHVPETIKDFLEGDAFREQVQKALPAHLTPNRYMRIALTALNKTPKLKNCDKASFFQCLLDLAQLGLEPDGRRAHLIPFEDKRNNKTVCTLIIDYKGVVELVMRSGLVSNLHADIVCENDTFDSDMGEIKSHKIDYRKPRGEAYAAYAICTFKDGSKKSEVMSVEDIHKIRDRSQAWKAYQAGYIKTIPWASDAFEMYKKTVFKRLAKWLPLSAEYRDALEMDVSDNYIDVKSTTAKKKQVRTLDDLANELLDGPEEDEPKEWVDAETGEIIEVDEDAIIEASVDAAKQETMF